MEFIRIGDKVINRKQVNRTIKKVLKLREKGYSQSRVAKELGLERSFVSRVESIGEVRKGKKIALVGFPIKNKRELKELALEQGVEFVLLFTEKERWDFIENNSGLELFNSIMEIMVKLKEFDLIIFLGSDMRLDLVDKLMDGNIVGMELGESPLKEDKYVDITEVEKIIKAFT